MQYNTLYIISASNNPLRYVSQWRRNNLISRTPFWSAHFTSCVLTQTIILSIYLYPCLSTFVPQAYSITLFFFLPQQKWINAYVFDVCTVSVYRTASTPKIRTHSSMWTEQPYLTKPHKKVEIRNVPKKLARTKRRADSLAAWHGASPTQWPVPAKCLFLSLSLFVSLRNVFRGVAPILRGHFASLLIVRNGQKSALTKQSVL